MEGGAGIKTLQCLSSLSSSTSPNPSLFLAARNYSVLPYMYLNHPVFYCKNSFANVSYCPLFFSLPHPFHAGVGWPLQTGCLHGKGLYSFSWLCSIVYLKCDVLIILSV